MMRASTFLGPRTEWPRPDADVRWGIGGAAVCLFSAQFLAGAWATLVVVAAYGDDGLPPAAERPLWILPAAGIGLWAAYLFGPGLINRVTGSGPMVDFELRAGPVPLVVAAVIGVATQLGLLPALYWLVSQVVSGDPGQTAEELVDRVDGPLDVVLLVLAVVVAAPLAEEWFYRGMALSALVRRVGPVGGAVISSAIFALVHQELILLPGLFVFALILSALTLWTGRLGVAVMAHLAFNATTVVQLLAF